MSPWGNESLKNKLATPPQSGGVLPLGVTVQEGDVDAVGMHCHFGAELGAVDDDVTLAGLTKHDDLGLVARDQARDVLGPAVGPEVWGQPIVEPISGAGDAPRHRAQEVATNGARDDYISTLARDILARRPTGCHPVVVVGVVCQSSLCKLAKV